MRRRYNKNAVQYINITIRKRFFYRQDNFNCRRDVNSEISPLLIYFGKREGRPS
jgi:hypothetical protein